MKDNFRILYDPPRKKVIDAIYFDLKIVRNKIVDLQVQIKYQPMFDKDDEALELLAKLNDYEDYLLMKLTEEKKVIRASIN